MRTFFIIAALAICTGCSIAQAADMPAPIRQPRLAVSHPPVHPVVVNCGTTCNFHKHSPDTGLKPAIRHEVCFTYTQVNEMDVTFTAYDVYEGQNSPNNHILRLLKHEANDPAHRGTLKKFCLGAKDWVSKMVWVDICDNINHSDRGIPSINEGLHTGEVRMCLLGEACPRFVR